MIKECKNCKIEFEDVNGNKKYCSVFCRQKWNNDNKERPSVATIIECASCYAPFARTCAQNRFCKDCQKLRRRAQSKVFTGTYPKTKKEKEDKMIAEFLKKKEADAKAAQ